LTSLCLVYLTLGLAAAQTTNSQKPVPILSGSTGAFSFVAGGHNLIDTQVNPVLLVPLGDRWLVESRTEFEGQFQRPPGGGPYSGPVNKHVDYAQVDYIASRYVSITAGRFLTPFGILNERLYPCWIRALQPDPLILPINTAPSDGAILRGGFPVSTQTSMSYAVYVSATSIGMGSVDSERHVGGRMGFFFPGRRLEVGFLAADATRRSEERFRLPHRMATEESSAQPARGIRPLLCRQRLLGRRRIRAEPGAVLAKGDAEHRSRGPCTAVFRG
jgi:hypothetical protein